MSQDPAVGILKSLDMDDAKAYHIECECMHPDHAVRMWIEVKPDQDIYVSFFVSTQSKFLENFVDRIKAAFSVLFKGYSQQEHELVLKKQAALNLSSAIKTSIKEIKEFNDDIK